MRKLHSALLLVAMLASLAALGRDLPTVDRFAARPLPNDPTLSDPRALPNFPAGARAQVEPRLGVPTFFWPAPGAGSSFRSGAASLRIDRNNTPAPVVAARGHLAQYADLYGLDANDVSTAEVAMVHDTGFGPVVVKMLQKVEGIEIFREEINVMMNQRQELVAIGGYITSAATPPASGQFSFTLDAREAAANAYQDLTWGAIEASQLQPAGSRDGYDYYSLPASFGLIQPIRMKKVYFHLPEGLEPAYYIELDVRDEVASVDGDTATQDYYSYVISAVDGGMLFRHNLTVYERAKKKEVAPLVSNPFTYRVWADPTGLPFDSPAGNGPHPKPTVIPDGFQAAFVGTNDVTISNYPFSMNDPWLNAGATETNGNNADAYVDLSSGDGFTPASSDFRGAITAPGEFLHVHTPGTAVNTTEQRHGSIQQLFFDINFLHDWFYDAGFDEVSRNAQTSNYGRGGAENDNMRAEAQDFSGRNNANMQTPADGARPRMQMYVFDTQAPKFLDVLTPPAAAGIRSVGTGQFGAQVFDMTDDLVQPATAAGCTAGDYAAVSGKIVMVNREPTSGVGSCSIGTKLNHAMSAGASGFVLVNLSTTPNTLVNVTGSLPTFTIPFLTITWNGAASIKTALAVPTPVTARMLRTAGTDRDGTIDNQIVAHEWGHYLSNRLIGNAAGLSSNQSRGMGEGWGDFTALMLSVRPDDTATPTNATWNGVYAMATYTQSGGPDGGANQGYYFGIRRYPMSTDMSKDPLTYQHIANGNPVVSPAPNNGGVDGSNMSQVHNTGEVWATMLWECYASLLRDTQGATPRMTFAEAQSRMKQYLVASLKMTPTNPTFVEARDAVLAAAYATDTLDFLDFYDAFAKRGLGLGAVATPDRWTLTNAGVVESFTTGPELVLDSYVVDDVSGSCDADGVLDAGEGGHVTVYLKNMGTTTLSGVTGTLTANTAGFSLPSGGALSFPTVDPFGVTSASVVVAADGTVAGITQADFGLQYTHPSLANIPRNATLSERTNTDVVTANSTTDSVEPPGTTWTTDFNAPLSGVSLAPFTRTRVTPMQHVWHGDNPGAPSDERLVSPVLTAVGGGPVTIEFDHSFGFEFDGGGNYDGGIVEVSVNGGAFTQIGGAAGSLPNYNGTLLVYGGNLNPLQGKAAFVQNSGGTIHTSFATAALNAGDTVQFRFRFGTDNAIGAPGWDIDNIQITGITTTPFDSLVGDTPCNIPTATSLVSSLNPSTFGASVTFTATVSSGAGAPSGTVTFKEGAATLAAGVPLVGGVATYNTSSLAIGPHSIHAVYGGAPGFLGSTSNTVAQVVNKALTTTTLVSAPNPSAIGANVTLTATVTSDVGTPAGSVTFADGITTLAVVSLSSGVAVYNTTALSAGPHALSATYGGNATYGGSSDTENHVVDPPALNFNPVTYFALEDAGTVTLTITRTGGTTTGASSVTVTTADGSAADGVRYTGIETSVEFESGETSKTFTVPLIDGTSIEGMQDFTVTMSLPVGATLGAATVATVNVVDDDTVNSDFSSPSDGSRDIVWRNATTGDTRVWQMNGTTFIDSTLLENLGAPWTFAAIADVNADGKADILWRNSTTQALQVWYMNGMTHTGTAVVPGSPDANWQVVAAGDMNGDGFADIIWRHATTHASAIWLMRDTTVLGVSALPTVPDVNWKVIGLGDFNRDGKLDIVWRNSATKDCAVWLMNFTTFTTAAFLPKVGAPWQLVGIGDMNDDGDADMLWQTTTTRQLALWQMNQTAFGTAYFINTSGDSTTANDPNYAVVAPK